MHHRLAGRGDLAGLLVDRCHSASVGGAEHVARSPLLEQLGALPGEAHLRVELRRRGRRLPSHLLPALLCCLDVRREEPDGARLLDGERGDRRLLQIELRQIAEDRLPVLDELLDPGHLAVERLGLGVDLELLLALQRELALQRLEVDVEALLERGHLRAQIGLEPRLLRLGHADLGVEHRGVEGGDHLARRDLVTDADVDREHPRQLDRGDRLGDGLREAGDAPALAADTDIEPGGGAEGGDQRDQGARVLKR